MLAHSTLLASAIVAQYTAMSVSLHGPIYHKCNRQMAHSSCTSASVYNRQSALGDMRALGRLHRLLLPSALQLLPRGRTVQATTQLPTACTTYFAGSAGYAADHRFEAKHGSAWGPGSHHSTFAQSRPPTQVSPPAVEASVVYTGFGYSDV
jgi:hypothetical protein